MNNKLLTITARLTEGLKSVKPGAYFITNPLEYAYGPYAAYLETYGSSPKKAVFLGMNPGPNGMAQTGIPFGDVKFVTNYLKISGKVVAPKNTHPKRPVNGFLHSKGEASGNRLWGYIQSKYPNANDFFNYFFVLNYCPLIIFDNNGKNITPDKLPRPVRNTITQVCDAALKDTLDVLCPHVTIGIGRYAQQRLQEVYPQTKTVFLPHPSPANPNANKNWAAQADKILTEEGIFT